MWLNVIYFNVMYQIKGQYRNVVWMKSFVTSRFHCLTYVNYEAVPETQILTEKKEFAQSL